MAFKRRRTANRRCGARSKIACAAQLRLAKNVPPKEQVTASEALDRVVFPEGRERGSGDPCGCNPLMEHLKGVDARDAPLM